MKINHISVYFFEEKIYIPTPATSSGPRMEIEPLMVANPNVQEVVLALQQIIDKGYGYFAGTLNREFYRTYKHPILELVKVKSWRAFAHKCIYISIEWELGNIVLYRNRPDYWGGFRGESSQVIASFLESVLLTTLAACIIQEISSPAQTGA